MIVVPKSQFLSAQKWAVFTQFWSSPLGVSEDS